MSANWKFVFASVLCLGLATAQAQVLPPALSSVQPELAARGSGNMRWFGLKLYQATLFTPGGQAFSWQAPFALAIRYDRAFSADELAASSRDEMAKLGAPSAELPTWYGQMQRVFVNVQAGDVIVGAYTPDGATRFWHNGRPSGQVADPRFGPRFFAIWLSPDTREPALRRALLDAAR